MQHEMYSGIVNDTFSFCFLTINSVLIKTRKNAVKVGLETAPKKSYSWCSSNAQASERTGTYYILQSEGSEGGRCHPLSTCGRQENIKVDSNSTLVIFREALGS